MKGDELKQWRKRHGFSQEALALELDVARQTIAQWERLDQPLSRVIVLAIAALEAGVLPLSIAGKRATASQYRAVRKRDSDTAS
jgi:transcriptional regulator with XRE-family HTH domain